MSEFDFIPQNVDYQEEHVEQICRCIMDDMSRSIYDGRNIYAKEIAVCRNNETGVYEWEDVLRRKGQTVLFYPSTEELKEAMERFNITRYTTMKCASIRLPKTEKRSRASMPLPTPSGYNN